MRTTEGRTASGDRRSCFVACATAVCANSVELIVRTSPWNRDAMWGGSFALASPPRGTRVYASIATALTFAATSSGDDAAVA
jgi:hypothetical protein